LTAPLDDAEFVREQYATEDNLRAGKAANSNVVSDDPRQFAFAAVERIPAELGAEVIGVDQSERMVEIQRSKGIDARMGDVQEPPFENAELDVAVAAWMLYHVPDLDRGHRHNPRVRGQPG
jgi:SAM-dependent methyltransferase